LQRSLGSLARSAAAAARNQRRIIPQAAPRKFQDMSEAESARRSAKERDQGLQTRSFISFTRPSTRAIRNAPGAARSAPFSRRNAIQIGPATRTMARETKKCS
jgi:hypothetical protein